MFSQRDLCQQVFSDLALDDERFGEVEGELHRNCLKPFADQTFWRLASWRLTFHNPHNYWYRLSDNRGLESPFKRAQCWNLSYCRCG